MIAIAPMDADRLRPNLIFPNFASLVAHVIVVLAGEE
jgi:hypothetical protein